MGWDDKFGVSEAELRKKVQEVLEEYIAESAHGGERIYPHDFGVYLSNVTAPAELQ